MHHHGPEPGAEERGWGGGHPQEALQRGETPLLTNGPGVCRGGRGASVFHCAMVVGE